jgi:hypothetical protein
MYVVYKKNNLSNQIILSKYYLRFKIKKIIILLLKIDTILAMVFYDKRFYHIL